MGKSAKPKVLLDSSVLLSWIKGEPLATNLTSLMKQIEDGEVTLYESVLVFAEVFKRSSAQSPEQRAHENKRLEQVKRKLRTREVQLLDVSLPVVEQAALLREEHGLKTPDAIHLATAILNTCDWFVTFDTDFPTDRDDIQVILVQQGYPYPWDPEQPQLPLG